MTLEYSLDSLEGLDEGISKLYLIILYLPHLNREYAKIRRHSLIFINIYELIVKISVAIL